MKTLNFHGIVLDEKVCVCQPKLISLVGFEKAVILQVYEYKMTKSRAKYEPTYGHYWFGKAFITIKNDFPWWPEDVALGYINELINDEYILTTNCPWSDKPNLTLMTINYDKIFSELNESVPNYIVYEKGGAE